MIAIKICKRLHQIPQSRLAAGFAKGKSGGQARFAEDRFGSEKPKLPQGKPAGFFVPRILEVVQLEGLHMLAISGGRRSCGALTQMLGRSLALPLFSNAKHRKDVYRGGLALPINEFAGFLSWTISLSGGDQRDVSPFSVFRSVPQRVAD